MRVRRRAHPHRMWRVACIALLAVTLAAPRGHVMAAERTATGSTTETAITHRVDPGDTLWSIAERYLGDSALWRMLRDINGVREPRRLTPGSMLSIPLDWLPRRPSGAEVVSVAGAVHVAVSSGATAVEATPGARLLAGGAVETAAGASASLRFDDGTVVVLLEGSRLEILLAVQHPGVGIERIQARLVRGRAETMAPARGARRFRLDTPNAVTSVRGTQFRTRAAAPDGRPVTHVEVMEGAVDVSNAGGAARVAAGFGTVASGNAEPAAIRSLPAAPDLTGLPAMVDRVPIEFAPSPGPGVTGFVMQIARASRPDVAVYQGLSASRRLRAPDLPDGPYLARIRAVDAAGLEGSHSEHPFILDARPEAPIPMVPAAGARVVPERPRFEWARNPEADHYHFQLARDARFAELLHEARDLSGTAVDLPVDLSPGTYHWRVAGIDAEGRGPWADPVPFRRLAPGPSLEGQPDLSGSALSLAWRSGRAGDRWRLQVAPDPSFAAPLADAQVAEPRHAMPRPAPGRYYLRVQTIEADGEEGPWGAPQSIDVPAPPPPPAPHTPWWLMLAPLLFLLIP